MGHAPSCLDEPLKPHQRFRPPPWIGRFTGREYHGKPEWWADIAQEDQVVRAGQYRGHVPRLPEEDRFRWNPPVPDGQSHVGMYGKDSTYGKNLSKKGDQPGDLRHFQRKLMEGSAQYKQIAEKFHLSKEHPGIAVSPALRDLYHIPVDMLGQITSPSRYRHLGPRFWDKPINDGCVEKGLALVKYTAIATAVYTVLKLRAMPSQPYGKLHASVILKTYARLLPVPCAVALVYGVTLCTSAKFRYKDDLWNYTAASAMLAVTLSTITQRGAHGFSAFLVSMLAGTVYQYARCSEGGLQGRATQQMIAGVHGGPHSWKWFEHGESERPPARTY